MVKNLHAGETLLTLYIKHLFYVTYSVRLWGSKINTVRFFKKQKLFYFGCTVWLLEAQFPDQGLNPSLLAMKAPRPNHWTTRESPTIRFFFFNHKVTYSLGLPRWLNGKESAYQCRKCRTQRFDPWAGKIPWRRKWQPDPAFLPGKSHGQRSLAGYSPWGLEESEMIEQLSLSPTPLK